ncbi:uncharacterized protein LOC122862851 isoform X2 [Siniperca chuatsi]|uniref:uncharacterized protein LOC122862851 isoform X2 n=1 Tax=Siniperca chuatsi TaxID=119488 RepID=UPI001CE0F77F|nr:uncharacterized protein LOC122862851 isoform X2 [Siniperca chuatsi]
MSVLLKEIRSTDPEAARVLKEADLHTDSDIQSLTREDLHELFPGPKKLKMRRTIFEIIHKQKPIDVLIRDLKGFIPHESFRAALTNSGVLVDYLRILKDMKTQMNCVQSFLDAHIGLLEEFSQNQPAQESDKGSLSGTSTSDNCRPGEPYNFQTGGHPHGSQRGFSTVLSTQDLWEARYQMFISGQTFGAHQQLMDKVKDQGQAWFSHRCKFTESSEDYQITIVFCPISSRIGSDVEAAMTDVKGDKPVILVLMHHTHEVKYTTSRRTWNYDTKVVLHVNVFYHETVRGLLKCPENDHAVSEIRNKLLEYNVRRKDTSGNAVGVTGWSGSTGSTHVSGDGNNKGSNHDSSGGLFNFFRK